VHAQMATINLCT